jgi:SAM-dependent methyltransferase
MFPWPPPTVAIDIRLLIRALLAFGAGRVAPGRGHLASAYAVEHAGAIPGGQDIGAKNIMRTAAHAVRSVVGTNGVSDRLRRIEVGVEELRQRTAKIARASDLGTGSAELEAAPTANEPASTVATMIDHNMMIHQGRGALLRAMPPGANRLLSAGCSGTWYFDWMRQCYGDVPEHLGIEYYTPRPDDLPANVSWITNTVSDMSGVATASCDLVFSGQNIEHLWPAEVVAFLVEAARVTRPGGHLVIDSPNRTLTAAMNYSMAEHTFELTVDEIRQAVTMAGFDETKVAGIWLCRDPRTGRVLPFDSNQPDVDWSVTERLVAAGDHPNDSFIWWLEARRTARTPELATLRTRINGIFANAWPERIQRLIPYPGRDVERRGGVDWIIASPGEAGFAMYGPYMPLRPGRYRCKFFLASEAATGDGRPLAVCDVVGGPDTTTLARGEVRPGQSEITLEFTLDRLLFAMQFRCVSHGNGGFAVARHVTLEEPHSGPESISE